MQFATNGADALRLARESPPTLVLLDAQMPGMSGFQVCEAFKKDPVLADIPVIFVTHHSEPAFEVSGFDAGAVDFIAKPVSAPLLLARVKTHLRLSAMSAELRRVATIDGLTNVANRRFFDQALRNEWKRALRGGDALSLLMIDVDHFKLFNDHHGHPAGDACLQQVARSLSQAGLRPADRVARYGGEEFVLLLPRTTRKGAEHVAARVLEAVAALDIPHPSSPTASKVTVSIGIGCFDEDSVGWVGTPADSRFAEDMAARLSTADFVRAADVALYAAKAGGRVGVEGACTASGAGSRPGAASGLTIPIHHRSGGPQSRATGIGCARGFSGQMDVARRQGLTRRLRQERRHSTGLSTPNRLRPAFKSRFKRFGRCVPPRFCRVRCAVGKEKGRLKTLSSASGSELVLDARNAMGKVAASVHGVRGLIQKAARSGQDERPRLERLGSSLREIDNSMQQNASFVEQLSATTQSLRDQEHLLRDSIEAFVPAGRAPALSVVAA